MWYQLVAQGPRNRFESEGAKKSEGFFLEQLVASHHSWGFKVRGRCKPPLWSPGAKPLEA